MIIWSYKTARYIFVFQFQGYIFCEKKTLTFFSRPHVACCCQTKKIYTNSSTWIVLSVDKLGKLADMQKNFRSWSKEYEKISPIRFHSTHCHIQWLLKTPLCIKLRIKTWLAAHFFNFLCAKKIKKKDLQKLFYATF